MNKDARAKALTYTKKRGLRLLSLKAKRTMRRTLPTPAKIRLKANKCLMPTLGFFLGLKRILENQNLYHKENIQGALNLREMLISSALDGKLVNKSLR